MPLFTVRSAVAGLVSLLNDDNDPPHASEEIRKHSGTSAEGIARSLPRRMFACPTCQKSFTTSGHLTRHSAMHTGERAFVCPYPECVKRSSRQDNLVQHYRMHLPNELRKQPNSYVRGCMEEMRARTGVGNSGRFRGEREAKRDGSRARPPPPTFPDALRGPHLSNIMTQPSTPPIPGEEPSPTLTYASSGNSAPSSPSRYLNTPSTVQFREDRFKPTSCFTQANAVDVLGFGWAFANDCSRYAISHVRGG